ncbi:hypothetical protein GOBAR_DD12313 [Gossypium barbadense]|nr:hypothetical protein GOBAR_DD12313 [Gossypium barbadense]
MGADLKEREKKRKRGERRGKGRAAPHRGPGTGTVTESLPGAGVGHRVRWPEKGMEELVVEEEHAAADGVRRVGVWGCYSGAVYGAKYKWGGLRLSRLQ